MFQFDVLSLIPPSLKRQAIDAAVDFVSDQAKKFLGDELSTKIKKLRSDATFQASFAEGLQRAADRFATEYALKDEDLVTALVADRTFFQNEEIQQALLAILKKPGVYLADEQEIIAHSFNSVLPNRLNRDRVNRAVIAFLRYLAEEVWNLPELRPAYELQFQRMTAEGIREQVNLQKVQLQATATLSADIRDALLQLTDAIAEQKLLPGGDPLVALPAPKKVYHNLPQPDYGHFVGREAELAKVVSILRPYPKSQHALVTIDGIGGIGKSALALEVAHRYLRNYDRIPPEEGFEAIIWTSAKQIVLTAEGIKTRHQILRTLDDIYTAIAAALQREDITRARPEEQAEVVRNALTRQRTLFIVDNLETVDDEAVLAFLRELPAPTKAIVTTRHRIDVAYPVRLVGMPWEDADKLIAQEGKKKGVILSADETRHLYDRTGGVPLAIVWSVAQMGLGYGVEPVLTRLGQPTGDIARFCFEGAVERIRGKPSHKLLMALALFATDASREALGYVADLLELDRDEALVELEKLSLVNREAGRFWLLPLTMSYSKAELGKEIELENLFRNRWIEFLLNFLARQGQNEYERLINIEPEVNTILSAIDWCWSTNRLEALINFAKEMSDHLWVTGNWGAWQRCLELGLQASVSFGAESAQVYFLTELAYLKDYEDDLDAAQDLLRQAINICRLKDDKSGLVRSLQKLAAIQYIQGEHKTARENANEALVIAKEIKKHTPRLQCRLAGFDIAEENYEAAAIRLDQIKEAPELNTDTWLTAWFYRLLGRVSLGKQDYVLANQYFQQSLEIADRIGSKGDVAQTQIHIAKLESILGHRDQAIKILKEAIAIFAEQGMKRHLGETQMLFEKLKNS
jgi:LuxR family glucitol operon transcriptional activator